MNEFTKINNNFIKKNEWIIYYALSKYPWLFRDEDLMQEAKIWLCEAKLKFNNNRSSWKTFASNYIKWAYGSYKKKGSSKKTSAESSGFSNVGLDAILEKDLYKLCKDHKQMTECKDDEMTYDALLDKIPEGRSKEIVILYTMGYGATEIAKRFDITKQRVWQLYKLEFDKLKKLIQDDK
jgi:RNA polymerase sigma factor (sigma-70 family)